MISCYLSGNLENEENPELFHKKESPGRRIDQGAGCSGHMVGMTVSVTVAVEEFLKK